MAEHAVLDRNIHRDLGVRSEVSAELGDGVMACITVPAEFRRIQNEYPILFRRDVASGRLSALALLGFEDGENLFLDKGRWDAGYRPLALAIQPFLIGRPADGEGEPQVHIDLAHPRVATAGARTALFDDLGQPTPYLEQVASMLGELDEGYQASEPFFAALQRHELIEPLAVDIELADGSKNRLVGYHIIDEEKLQTLEPGALAELHEAGHLMPIFMAVASLSNLTELVRRKNRRMGLA